MMIKKFKPLQQVKTTKGQVAQYLGTINQYKQRFFPDNWKNINDGDYSIVMVDKDDFLIIKTDSLTILKN